VPTLVTSSLASVSRSGSSGSEPIVRDAGARRSLSRTPHLAGSLPELIKMPEAKHPVPYERKQLISSFLQDRWHVIDYGSEGCNSKEHERSESSIPLIRFLMPWAIVHNDIICPRIFSANPCFETLGNLFVLADGASTLRWMSEMDNPRYIVSFGTLHPCRRLRSFFSSLNP
jgi:hypothetical protein